ncbi:MAG: beta-hydroxyacyl-ACP dehydratase [Gemmatirosa sp.]|nr:beta-hydroxyacyl-ACP dehydratase [Gemmatirosa sp.]
MPASALDVRALLPHRYPLLLVDAITDVEPGRRAVGRKCVTGAEWCAGSPAGLGRPGAMPHTLIVEALAQLSAAILVGLVDRAEGAVGYFLGLDRVRCRGTAAPGDVIELEVALVQFRRGICRTRGVARVGSTVVVRADLTTVVRPAPR